MSGGWNFAEIWERIADKFPDAQAQVQGDRRFTWTEFDRRADGIARTLLDHGAGHQDKVALYLYNGPEYMETAFACYKASLVPVNTNYRYIDDELTYLWDNADAVAVVFHGEFTPTIERIRSRVPDVKVWLWVDDGNGGCPEWAIPYEDAAATETDGNEIIVTGLKFDRTLQDTPTSVKVFTSEEIDKQNLISVYDLIDRTANLSSTFAESGFNIRGISSTNVSGTGFGDLATVYLDGSPLPREASGGGPLDLWDLEQVEILRGPQSTLQGRNALAGAIILKTADPSFDWQGKARAMITDADGEYRLAAAVAGPIIPDVLAFRVAGERARGDGLIENSFTGSDYAKSHSDVLRTKLLFTPWGPDGLRIVASYLYDRHFGNDGRGYTFTDLPNSWKRRTVDANRETYSKTSTDLFTFDISLPLGDVFTLSSISTYNHLKTFSTYDGDLRRDDEAYGDYSTNQKIFSQELRLTFDTGPLQGLVGAYYSKHKNPDYLANSTFSLDLDENLGLTSRVADFLVQNAGFDPATALGTAQAVRGVYPQRVFISSVQLYPFNIETQALFGDASWEVAPGLKLLAGFRYDREKQIVRNENAVTLNTVLPNPADYAANPTFAFILQTVNNLLLSDVSNANSSGPQQKTTYQA